jgi:lipopolysaccharide transport system permease protein
MSYSNYQTRKVPAALRYISDLWRYRHLCWHLVGSDLRSRYRRSRLGILWAVIQPLGYAAVIAWAWGSLFGQEDYLTFGIYVFSGMLIWEYFSNTLNASLDALQNAVGYLRQSRMPFVLFQARVPLTGLANLIFGMLGLFAVLAAAQQFPFPGLHLLLVPAYVAILFLFMLPLAVIFSVIGAQYRDVKHIMGIALQLLFFLSPIFAVRSFIDDPRLAILNYANPLVPLMDLFRDPVLYGRFWEQQDVVVVSVWGAVLWVTASVIASRAGRNLVFALT